MFSDALLVNFLMFVFSTIGLTNIIIDSSLFSPVRNILKKILPSSLYSVFECNQCMGTWAGFFCGSIFLSDQLIFILCCGFAGSNLSVLSFNITNYLEAKTISLLDGESENE